MKKRSLKLFICASLLVLSMGFTACGGSGSDKKDGDTGVVNNESQASDADKADDANKDAEAPVDNAADEGSKPSASGKYATVQEFAESDEMQSQLEAQLSAVEEMGMNMTITGEGNKLIYTYTYQETFSEEEVAAAAEVLETESASLESQMKTVIDAIKLATEEENPVVEVKYMNGDGTLIYSVEFK